MKNLTKMIGTLLPVLFTALMVSSCVKDTEIDSRGTGSGEGDKTVTFAMRVPSNDNPGTRALGSAQEDEVDEVHVLVIHTSTGNVFKHEVATPSAVQSGNKRVFEVTLPVGTYNIAVVANAGALITSKYPAGISKGTTLASVRENLILARQQAMATEGNRAGDKWNTTVNASKGYLIPMWGQLSGVTITDTPATDQNIGTVNVYRMVAKIDVRVPRTTSGGAAIIPAADFAFTSARFYNYNTKGYVIPEPANGNWEQSGGGKASGPSAVPASGNFVNGDKKYQEYTAINNSYTVPTGDVANAGGTESALIGEIYTFEVGAGSDYTTRPCVIIGGTWKGTQTWYRVDMVGSSSGNHLALLRNHRYVVWVKSIKGPGYATPEEAYKSKPINLEATVIPWDEGAFLEGVWNGNNFIKFSTLEANFTQFAEDTHVVTVKSDLGDIKFTNFQNTQNVGSGDVAWTESPAGTWSNGHFRVVKSGPTQQGGDYLYTLTITATPTTSKATDPARHSYFNIVGSNLNATFNIYQDAHLPFLLETDPPHQGFIRCSGANQRVAVKVNSTHNYAIELSSTGTMFGSVYEDEAKARQINDLTNIDKGIKTVYVDVLTYADIPPRVGTVNFTHAAGQGSDAGSSIVTVIQMTPMITAQLTTGERYTAEIPKAGGSVTIDVKSNMSAWIPVLTRTVGTSLVNEDLTSAVGTYFTPANGSSNQTVTFRVPALADTETADHVYSIQFKDASGDTKTTPVIRITHIAKKPGAGGGGTPPTGGVLAPEGILAVDKDGILNLDGPARQGNYIVYFKWGSTIAIAGAATEFSANQIAWTPEGYPYDALMTDIGTTTAATAWGKVPYQSTGTAIVENAAAGTGDPCKLAVKNGTPGGYRMPSGATYPQAPSMGWTTYNGSYGHWYHKGQADQQFYPAAGYRYDSGGAVNRVASYGYCWSSTSNGQHGCCLAFSSSYVLQIDSNNREFGFAVRCVQE